MKNFLNSIVGSWLKVFLAAVLGEYLALKANGVSIFDFDKTTLDALVTAGIVAVFPIIINFLNPNDSRYGFKK